MPSHITIDFNDPIRLDSLEAADLTINGIPAQSVSMVDADTAVFQLPAGLGDGTHDLAIADGAILDLQNTPLQPFGLQLSVEPAWPLVISELMAINETFLPDGDGDYRDWLEIHNPTTDDLDLAGWYLTDSLTNLRKWQFPSKTLPAGGYTVVFASDKDADAPAGELHTNFKLDGDGEYLALVHPSGSVVVSSYAPEFPSQFADISYGWSSDSSKQGYFLEPTPGGPNIGQPVDDPTQLIVISEIMYHPATENDLEEYIELYNRGIAAVDLLDWQFDDGVGYTFPAVTLQPGDYLVVAADTATFTAKYPTVTNFVGGWTGQLSNRGERITLIDAAAERADRVEYADEGHWGSRELGPLDRYQRGWQWVDDHDGGGKSLELINPNLSNQYGQNWAASLTDEGTPGSANSVAAADIAPIIVDVTHRPIIPRSSDPVTVTARVIDELSAGVTATLYYRVDTSTYSDAVYPVYNPADYTTVEMLDDGLHGDGASGDGIYGAEIPAQSDGAVVEFFVEATDVAANSRTTPAPSSVDGTPQQVTNLLYQVLDSFDPTAAWTPGDPPMVYLIMTNSERLRLADIGDGSGGEHESNAQMNATFISVDGTGAELRYNVGVRNRGSASRTANPNNHRVNFLNDERWHDVTGINLNSRATEYQVIGSLLLQMAGFESADATSVRVRVNGADLSQAGSPMYGRYTSLEVVDGDFVDGHFPENSGGNAYILHDDIRFGHGDLDYEGTNPDAYRDTYFKRTNEENDDWSDLIHMLDVLNNAPEATYLQDIAGVIDVDQWLRYIATDALIGNAEGGLMSGRGDDFIMYCGTTDSRFVLVPHDLDTLFSSPSRNILSGYRTAAATAIDAAQNTTTSRPTAPTAWRAT